MPNHVHVLVTPSSGHGLSDIVHTWKSWSAKVANRVLGRTGVFWQREYFDRLIRDERHFAAALSYIEENPVKAGLCDSQQAWRYGSARRRAPRGGALLGLRRQGGCDSLEG